MPNSISERSFKHRLYIFFYIAKKKINSVLLKNQIISESQVINTSAIGISNFMKKSLKAKKVFLRVYYTHLLQFAYEIHFFYYSRGSSNDAMTLFL